MADTITLQYRPLDVLVTGLHKPNTRKIFEMVDTRSNMQLDNLNYKSHCRKSLRDIIDCVIGFRFYPTSGSEHYKLLHIEQFHVPSNINGNHKNNNETTFTRIV